MENVIRYMQELFPADKFIVTGSYALSRLGLWNYPVKDLDILIYKPTNEAMELLKSLNDPPPEDDDYPEKEGQYKILFPQVNGEILKVDIWVEKDEKRFETAIALADGITVATPVPLIKAKKSYKGLKHLMQRKMIAELFYTPGELETWIANQAKSAERVMKTTGLKHVEKTLQKPFQAPPKGATTLEEWRKAVTNMMGAVGKKIVDECPDCGYLF